MIYLDNAATTKPAACLAPLFDAHLQNKWFNPSAMYPPAVEMERALREAARLLRPGGALLLSDLSTGGEPWLRRAAEAGCTGAAEDLRALEADADAPQARKKGLLGRLFGS